MISVNLMLRTMKCLVAVMMVLTTVTGGSVIDRGDRWIPMEEMHKIHARTADYADNSATDEGGVDLHNEEFCVDVSTYQPVVWVERDGEECKTEFVKQCEDKTEEVCAEVTETTCEVVYALHVFLYPPLSQVVPYKECKAGVEPQLFSDTKLSPKKFIEKTCIQTKKTIPHKKLLPECRNVTKQNCVLTNKDQDSYGNQVRDCIYNTKINILYHSSGVGWYRCL